VDNIERLLTLMTGDEKHDLASYSTLDVLRVLYERVLEVSPETVDDPRRDRFLLSKGHGPTAYYAVLCDRGFIPESWLEPWGTFDSPLGYHPDRNLVPGVEISTPGTRLRSGWWPSGESNVPHERSQDSGKNPRSQSTA